MAIPEFQQRPPRIGEVQRYGREVPKWLEKRKQEAAWFLEYKMKLRKLRETDPEAAEEFEKRYAPPEQLIAKLHQDIEADYQELPLTQEEIEREFSSESLSEKSLDEYIELLRKVPPRFLTHVTRQGVRDNISFHTGGYGEFNNGFTSIVEAGSLRSTLEQRLLEGITEDTVRDVLINVLRVPEDFPTREEALKTIEFFLNQSMQAPASSEFADSKTIHMALDVVAEEHYGAETGNQFFFVYPAAYLAANYDIGEQRYDLPAKFKPDDQLLRYCCGCRCGKLPRLNANGLRLLADEKSPAELC